MNTKLQPKNVMLKDKTQILAYSYTQAHMIIGCKYLNYVRQLVSQGRIRIAGSEPIAKGSEVFRTLLYAEDVEKVAADYEPREDDGRREYSFRADGDEFAKVKAVMDELGLPWKDLTEVRRQYARSRKDQGK
jgi:hypothetical protein